MKLKLRIVRGVAAVCAMLCGLSSARGALLYHWTFDDADGSNSGAGSGGVLTANVGAGATTGSFGAAGVSGVGGSFHAFNG